VPADLSSVVPITAMTGEDAEDTALLKAAFQEARAYLGSFKWVRSI
jgi:hypothetical protein